MDASISQSTAGVTLVGRAGEIAGEEHLLLPPIANIGRAPTCEVQLHSAEVSRYHCRIVLDSLPVRVVDDGSLNRTFVNGLIIDGERPLRDGDVLRIGPFEFSVQIDSELLAGLLTKRLSAFPEGKGTGAMYDQAQAGDEEAGRQLYYRFLPRLTQIAEQRMGGHLKRLVDSEDVAQEALVEALLEVRAYDFQRQGSFLAFLRNKVENIIRDRHRHWTAQKRDARRVESLSSDDEARQMAERGDSKMLRPETIVDFQEQCQLLNQALDRLPPETRKLIQMSRIEERTNEEIGAELGLTRDAVRMRVKRAIEELRLAFEVGANPRVGCDNAHSHR